VAPSLRIKMVKKTSTLGGCGEHFKEVGRALSFLRRNEHFTNLAFICCPLPDSDSGGGGKGGGGRKGGAAAVAAKVKMVHCHRELFAPHSKLLANLFAISELRDPSGVVCINLEGVEGVVVEKLVDYLYLGQATVKAATKEALQQLCGMLEMDIVLPEPISSESSEEDVPMSPPPPKSPAKKAFPSEPGGGRKERRQKGISCGCHRI